LVEWLIVFRRAPFGWVNAVEALRLSAAAAAEHRLELLFVDDGVFCLLKGQAPKGIGYPGIDKPLRMLKELDVKYYVDSESLEERGLKEDDIDPRYGTEMTSSDEMGQIVMQNKVVLCF
jgi:sulfur relay protein TusC/DsrF